MPTEAEDFLAHYGVVGMKWGKRRGSLASRAKGAALDSVQRRLTTHKEIAEGRGKIRDYNRVATRNIVGNSQKAAARRTKKLEASQKRIQAGKPKVRDILMAVGTTTPIDLLVSRQDKRGLPGAAKKSQSKGRTRVNAIIGGGSGAALIGFQAARVIRNARG